MGFIPFERAGKQMQIDIPRGFINSFNSQEALK